MLEATTRHQLAEHLPEILPPIQAALCDADTAVREAAGAAFGVLFRGGAHSAVDGVVPSLLAGLDNESHYNASIEGLRVILGVRPTTFNAVAPKLLRPPVTSPALRALGELAGVAGECRLRGSVSCSGEVWRVVCTFAMCAGLWQRTINLQLQQSERGSQKSTVADTISRNSLMPVVGCTRCVFVLCV